jgi:hypothetical protein
MNRETNPMNEQKPIMAERLNVACLVDTSVFGDDPALATAACEDFVAAVVLPWLRKEPE